MWRTVTTAYSGADAVVVVVLETVPVAEVGVEAAVRGRVLFLEEAQVPLADGVGGVTGVLEVLREDLLRQRQAPRLGFQDHQVLHS